MGSQEVRHDWVTELNWPESVVHTRILLCVCSVTSDSVISWTVAHQDLCPWNFPGKNTGVGCYCLLQGIFLTQGLNPCLLSLLHCRRILYHWTTKEVPQILLIVPIKPPKAPSLPDQDPILVAFSCSLVNSFNLDEFLHLVFMILMFSKIAGQLLCRISFSLGFLMFLCG